MTINTNLANAVVENVTIPESNSSDWIYNILFDNSDYELTTNYSSPVLIDDSPPLKRRCLERGTYGSISSHKNITPTPIVYQFIPYVEPGSIQQIPEAPSQQSTLVKPLDNLPTTSEIKKSHNIATNSFSFFSPSINQDNSVSWDFDGSQSNKNRDKRQVNYGFGQLTVNNSELDKSAHLFK